MLRTQNLEMFTSSCIHCKEKILNYRTFSNDTDLTYFKWKKTTKEIETKKKLKKKQVLTVKKTITVNPLTAIKELKTLIKPFFFAHS